MNDKLAEIIRELGIEFSGNVAKIQIGLARKGYNPPTPNAIKSCLEVEERRKFFNTTASSIPKKVGKKESNRGIHSLS